jgi:choline/glycine/proline betaine transport protein
VAPFVFYPAAALIGAFVVWALMVPGTAAKVLGAIHNGIVADLGWYYVLLVAGFVVFSLWLAISRYGDIRLGRDDEEPEFGVRSWFAMLFSTGMGIGLVFWGVAEPLNHFASPRPGFHGDQVETARQAITQTYVHWGVHAWAIYVVAGLGVGYAVHRRGRPVSIRWALEPLLGARVRGHLGDVIDVTAVVGTLFGLATSLGFGVAQLGAGLQIRGVVDDGGSVPLLVLLVLAITAVATLSVVSGVDRGIKWLSNFNMGLAGVVLVFILIAGPTLFLLREFVQSFGDYLTNVVSLTFDVSAYQGAAGERWQASWTTFYWGWWISWAPFVGVFIARISRGRTVREFVTGVLLAPTLVTFLWFSVLGGSALYRQMFGAGGLIGPDGSVGTESSLFMLLGGLPGVAVMSGLVLLLIVTFFVTSADSGSLVVAMLAAGGDPDPPRWARIVWAGLGGLIAAALLTAGGGGLGAIQTAAIVIALPFSVVLVLIAVATARALHREHHAVLRRRSADRLSEVTEQISDRVAAQVSAALDDAELPSASNGRRRMSWLRRGP